MDFKIGDRVTVIFEGATHMPAYTHACNDGTIIGFDEDGWAAVQFDTPNTSFHDCDGRCPDHCGYYIPIKNVRHNKNKFNCTMNEFQAFLEGE